MSEMKMKELTKEMFINQNGLKFFLKVAKSLLPSKELQRIENELTKLDGDFWPLWSFKACFLAAIDNSELSEKNHRFMVSLLSGFTDPYEITVSNQTGRSTELVWQDFLEFYREHNKKSLPKKYFCIKCGSEFVAERHLVENEHPFEEMCICDDCLPEELIHSLGKVLLAINKDFNKEKEG